MLGLPHRTFKRYISKIGVEGLSFDFFISDPYAQKYYAERKSSRQSELAFVRDNIIKKGDIIFDVGAHHGLHTLAYAIWTGASGMVYSFEAHPQNAGIIKKNIKLNNIGNVKVIAKAVGASSKSMYIHDYSNAHILVGIEENMIKTKMATLDTYIELKPDFLKIDVEGYETNVLKGASEVLKTKPKLSIEVHSKALFKYNSSFIEMLSLIDLKAYQCWILQDRDQPPQPYCLGNVVAERVNFFAIPKSKLSLKQG